MKNAQNKKVLQQPNATAEIRRFQICEIDCLSTYYAELHLNVWSTLCFSLFHFLFSTTNPFFYLSPFFVVVLLMSSRRRALLSRKVLGNLYLHMLNDILQYTTVCSFSPLFDILSQLCLMPYSPYFTPFLNNFTRLFSL